MKVTTILDAAALNAADEPSDGAAAHEATTTQAADSRIAELRMRLDQIDQSLIDLWLERAAISREVGMTRVAAGGTRLVLSREQHILDRYRSALGADGTQLALLVLRAGRGKLV